jgi:hypothetical protein
VFELKKPPKTKKPKNRKQKTKNQKTKNQKKKNKQKTKTQKKQTKQTNTTSVKKRTCSSLIGVENPWIIDPKISNSSATPKDLLTFESCK